MPSPELSTKRGYSHLLPRSKLIAALAGVATVLSVLELVNIFVFPLGSMLGQPSSNSGSFFSMGRLTSILDVGYAGLFALMALESASTPVPSEVVLPFAGYLVFLGKMNLGLAIADSTVAGVVGAVVIYYVALLLDKPVIYPILRRIGVTEKHIAEGERWISTKGEWGVLIARFIPGVRSVISVPAGILRMRLRPFVTMTFVGSLVWSAVLIYLGYSAGPYWQSALGSAPKVLDAVLLSVVAGVSILYIVFYFGPSRKGGRRI